MYRTKSIALIKKNVRKGSSKTKRDETCLLNENDASCKPLSEEFHILKGNISGKCDIHRENKDMGDMKLDIAIDDLSTSKVIASAKKKNPPKEKQTRSSSRIKMKQELARFQTDAADSDPEDSDNDAYETESESEEVHSSVVCDASMGKKMKPMTCSQAYFDAHKKSKASSTSNKTLSNIKFRETSVQELTEILGNAPNSHRKEKETLLKKYCSQFEKWMCMLGLGFNILFYGVGSKQKVLNAFCEKILNDELYVVLYGYFPTLSLKQVLCEITEDVLEYEGKFASLQDHSDYVKEYFSENNVELYVVIHNIDGTALRSSKVQSILAALAATPHIHFICSMDHMNTPLLWDQIMLSHFQWVWFDATTFEPYILETSYDNSLLKEQSSNLMLSSLLHVYNSLTPNNRGVFMILAKYQKEEQKKSILGMAFHEWYQECREAFLVNSEITMQAQISEFKNHKLLSSKKNSDGIELWYIPVDSATLEQFLENCL